MDYKEILKKCDHTLLKQTSTSEQIRQLCNEAITYNTASVCIPPCYIAMAHEEFPDLNICTVIGFPNGYMTEGVKCEEAAEAIKAGAHEIDMVINIGYVKEGSFDKVLSEIKALREVCGSEHILKVIIETCLLTEDEKIKMCEIVTEAKADYIKTSTGFSTGGATVEDIRLMKANIGEGVLVKAAGGISNFDDAVALIEAGADRLGTSRLVELAKNR